ncbi:MAG: DUF433 domain-containing protein [Panacagrimonas sp.]
MNSKEHIFVDPEVCFGKPHIDGTRLAVEFVMARSADGWTEEQVLESYTRLTRADLKAVFTVATEMQT